jgi:hypothetical protein
VEGRDYALQIRRVAELARRYNGARVRMDCTGNAALLEQLAASGTRCEGTTFTNAAKQELIDGLVLALEQGRVTFPALPQLIGEMRYYEYRLTAAGNVKLGAPERAGAHDDCVTALALAVQEAQTRRRVDLPFGWYRRDPDFRASVLGDVAASARRAAVVHDQTAAPGNASRPAAAYAAVQVEQAQPPAPSAMTRDEREQQRWRDFVSGLAWRE